MIGFKGFDQNFRCRGSQYEVGQTYEHNGRIGLCESGFHFCKTMAQVFNYYSGTDCRYAEVEAIGEIKEGDDKCVTNEIRIIREIPQDEAVRMTNTGNMNTGNRNTGDWNTGNMNTGDWNRIEASSGCFNTVPQKITLFNKPSEWTIKDWRNSDARWILNQMPQEIDVIDWIIESDMTDAEKEEHPTYKTTGGYPKVSKSSADKQAWWDKLPDEKKEIVKAIPNFDPDAFRECTGIQV